MYVRNILELFVLALTVLILGRVLVSWVEPSGRSQLSAFLIQVTEPILAPVRRMLPQTGMIDFSPMVVIIVLTFLLQAIR